MAGSASPEGDARALLYVAAGDDDIAGIIGFVTLENIVDLISLFGESVQGPFQAGTVDFADSEFGA